MKLVATALERADNVLGRRLEQADNVADKLVFALDIGKGLQLLLTNVYCFLHEGTLQHRKRVSLVAELLDELSRSIACVAEHQCGLAVEKIIESGIINIACLERSLEKRVLHAKHLDVA